jgi:hypothetical protein
MTTPLRILVLTPAPTDAPPFDADRAWNELARALAPAVEQGVIAVERLVPPTENALRKRLADGDCHVLHFIGHARWRVAAQYGTLMLESSSRESRGVTTQYFAELLASHPALRLAVLQTDAGERFEGEGHSIWEHGPAVLLASGRLAGPAPAVLARSLYSSLAAGSTLQEATEHARTALASTSATTTLVLKTAAPDSRVATSARAAPAEPPRIRVAAAPSDAETAQAAAQGAIVRELQRKRLAGEFDVFLCHNSSDKPRVRQIAGWLENHGVLAWLDERELPPGQPWQPLLEKQMASIKSAAVFVGSAGVGPWQEQELYALLSEFVSRRSPVIPVLLHDAPDKPELPIFLRAMTWVDFRRDEPDPLSRLIWGITGRRPES